MANNPANSYRLRIPTVTAYRYTGTSMDAAVVALLGIDNCVAATATRPALIKHASSGVWMELRPGMWAIVRTSGVELMGHQQFTMTYRDVSTEAVTVPPVDPGPDVP